MGVLRGTMNRKAIRYDLDLTQLTASRQPIERLVEPGVPIRVAFRPKREIVFYLTGQVATTDNIILSERELRLNQVVLVDGVYYRIMRTNVMRSPGAQGRRIVGWSCLVEEWRHSS